MNPHISFISCQFDSITEDSITVGIFYINQDGKVKTFISNNKLKIIKKIIPNNLFKFFTNYTKKLDKHNLIFSDICYLNRYQNGIIKVTKPTPIAIHTLEEITSFFEKLIDKQYK
jgi:hypothetical protein